MKRFIIVLLLAPALLVINAQTTQKLTATKASEYGLIYNLPMTVFDVMLEAECVVETPGELYQYAKIYLGIDPISKASTKWTLKSASLIPVGVKDVSEEYLVQFKSGSAPYITINEENAPLSINAPAPAQRQFQPIEAVALQPTVLESPEAAYVISSDMAASTSIAKRAELAAEKIYEIREARNEIISGQTDNMPNDGAAIQIALDNLAKQEAVLTAMFLGTRQTCTQVEIIRYVPGDNDERSVIARLSALKGIVPATDLTGDPIYLNLKIAERGQLPVNEKGEVKKFPKGGVAYRIPGKAQVTVTFDRRSFDSVTVPVAQYGVVFGLDPSLFTDKKAPSYLLFDPLTGAIKELGAVEKLPAAKPKQESKDEE